MKLTVIGGGGVRTPRLIPSLVRRAARLDLQELWLMDIDGPKLEKIGDLCRTLADKHQAPFSLHLTTDAREALRGAQHIITSIRPGKEQGRATDERIAFRHGVLGQETTGAAGFAMAMRSIPAILDYARLAAELAPGAWIYNFTNPAGLVAQALHYAGVPRVVGICDSANGAQHAASRYLGVPMARVRHEVFGLNHLSWTRSVRIDPDTNGDGGEEVLPALISDPRFIASTHMAMFDPDLVAALGMFLNEYLHYFYHRDEVLAALLGKMETRGEETLRLTRELLKRLEAARDQDGPARLAIYDEVLNRRASTYMAHARHAEPRPHMQPVADDEEGYASVALGCVEAIARDETHYTGLNVPNRGTIAGFRDDDVVEVTCRIDGSGPQPLPVGAIPDEPLALMQAVKHYERLAARSILARSQSLATQALAAHPLIGSYPLAKKLVAEFIEAHQDLIGEWN